MQMPPKQNCRTMSSPTKSGSRWALPDPSRDQSGQRHRRQARDRYGCRPPALVLSKAGETNASAVKTEGWAKTDIDRFILASMEQAGLHPVRDADRPTLIRRIAFDLTGLPPTPDEVKAFVADTSPDAVKRVIDILSTRRTTARSGHGTGSMWPAMPRAAARRSTCSTRMPGAIATTSSRASKGQTYDQFLKEQIAGDLMKFSTKHEQAGKNRRHRLPAVGSKGHNQRDRRQFQMDLVDEQSTPCRSPCSASRSPAPAATITNSIPSRSVTTTPSQASS